MNPKAIHAVQHCTTMTDVRCRVDALDDVLVPLLVQRAGYMTQAARIKQDVNQSATRPASRPSSTGCAHTRSPRVASRPSSRPSTAA